MFLTAEALVVLWAASACAVTTTVAASPTAVPAQPSARPSPTATRVLPTPTPLPPPDLTIEPGDQFVTAQGELAVLGWITNNEPAPVQVDRLELVAADTAGEPRATAVMQYGPRQLASGERVPFLAISAVDPGPLRWQPSVEARSTEPGQQAVELIGVAELRFTPQGQPFVLGELHNQQTIAQQARGLVQIWQGDRLVSLGEVDTPVPIEGGARLSFTVSDLPGFRLRAELGGTPQSSQATRPGAQSTQAAELGLRVEVRVESEPADGAALPVAAEVSVFQSVGSALFLRGSVSNNQAQTLQVAVVMAEVRRLDGALSTAGWSVLPGPLGPGEQRDYVLELPLELPIDATQVEFDLRAYGTRASE